MATNFTSRILGTQRCQQHNLGELVSGCEASQGDIKHIMPMCHNVTCTVINVLLIYLFIG